MLLVIAVVGAVLLARKAKRAELVDDPLVAAAEAEAAAKAEAEAATSADELPAPDADDTEAPADAEETV